MAQTNAYGVVRNTRGSLAYHGDGAMKKMSVVHKGCIGQRKAQGEVAQRKAQGEVAQPRKHHNTKQ